MPLAFNSLSHGEIAFGFFNTETDLLILDTYFVFASDFCQHVAILAEGPAGERVQTEWEVYVLREEQIGSLTAAVHGIDRRGLMGDVYRRFPLLPDVNALTQNPEGKKTRDIVTEMIERYEKARPIVTIVDSEGSTIEIGDYIADCTRFSRTTGWRPKVKLSEGLKNTFKYYEKNKKYY